MSDRPSDADLIRICLEGTTDDLTDEVVSQINDRIYESALLHAAVGESPIAEEIKSRVTIPSGIEDAQPAPAENNTSSRLKLISAALMVVLVVVMGVWLNGQHADNAGSGDVAPESTSTPVADSESRPAKSDSSGSDEGVAEVSANDSPATPATPAVAGTNDPTAGDADAPMKDAASPADTAKAIDPETDGSKDTAVAAANSDPTEAADNETPAWTEPLSLETPPRRFEEIAWLMPGQEQPDQFSPKEFQQWFARLPGKPFEVGEEKVTNRLFTRFSGIASLRAPWVDSAVLRFGLYDTERCALIVWHGNRGVRLQFYKKCNPNVWGVDSVSRTSREGEGALPRVGRFLTSDCGRWHRSNFGIFDLRWNDGYLRMVRGDVVLLAVPFAERPDEVVLDGKMKLREFRMFRSDPLPEYITQRTEKSQGQNSLATDKPADLEWSTTDVPDGTFSKDDDQGSVRLATTSESEKRALAFVKVPNAGLSEVIFRLGSADPGTGIYFGRPDGEQVFRISCVWDTGANKPALWFQPVGKYEVERRFDPDAYAVPWTGSDQWIRVVAGYGITTVQMSPDGRNWGWIFETPNQTDWQHIETIGLFTEPKGDRHIQLNRVSVNEFPTISTVADPDLVAQVNVSEFGPLNVLDDGSWLHRATKMQPDGIPFADWRRACAVATLRARPRAPLGTILLNGLLSDGAFSQHAARAGKPKVAWNLLNEISQLVSPLASNRAVQFQQLYHAIARRRVIEQFEGNALGTDAIDKAPANPDPNQALLPQATNVVRKTASKLLSLPLQTNLASGLTAQAAARLQLVGLVQAGRFEEVRQLVDEIVFWNSHAHPTRDWWSQVDPLYPTVAWAELRSHTELDTESQSVRMTLPRRWKTALTPERHPLAQPVSKEAYNVMAEFQAAVDGNAFQDACQVIASAGSADLIGLLPDSQDDQLLVSFPNAVAMAMDRHPELRQQMNERFGAVGRLRVRQAIENGDYRQVEAATVQFFGTPAAAESDLWLGDRAVAAGQFAQARSYFERAIAGFRKNSQVETAEITSTEARIKLVLALLGETPEDAAAEAEPRSVTIGSQQLSPQQLTALVGELTETRAQQDSAGTTLAQISKAPGTNFDFERIPLPVSHKIEKRATYEGDLGEHVGRTVPADTDWVSRQLASTISGDLAFLNNRFQVSCVDLTNGTTKWTQQLGADHGSANHWPMLAMRPLVAGDAVYCRRLTKKGTEIVCCKTDNGEVRWRKQIDQTFVSDPFLLRGRLQILSTNPSTIGPTVLNLLTVHRETGSILSTAPVLKLFDAWQNSTLVCQVAVQDGLFFISTVGAVACCNSEGQTLWVKRREWTPTPLDSRYRYARSWSPPVIFENQLIVGQPESPVIDCLEMATGRTLWQHVEPELRRIISQHDRALLMETRGGLKSISVETGQTHWLYKAADLLDGIAVGPLQVPVETPRKPADQVLPGANHILAWRLLPHIEGRTNTLAPTLVWIHAGTGREIARQTFLSIADREARVGSLLITKDHLWAFSGKNRKEGKRDIVELVPAPDMPLSTPINQAHLAPWYPEFLDTTFPDNLVERPDLFVTRIHRDSRNGVNAICPGWLLIAPPQPGAMGKRPDHRGQKDAVELQLQPKAITPEDLQALADAPLNSIRLMRDVYIPAAGDHSFKFKAGNNTGQSWNLTIDANGQQIHSTVISDETAPTGWTSIHTSLQRWSGQQVRILITCSLVDIKKQTSVFLSELNSSTLTRQPADN